MKKNFLLSVVLFVILAGCSSGDDSSELDTSLPGVQLTNISNISSNSALASGNVVSQGGSIVNARGFVWGTSSNPDLGDNTVNVGDGMGSFAGNIANLEPGTIYFVKAFATSSNGTSYSGEQSFTTTNQGCDANAYNGDVQLNTQTEVTEFGQNNYCEINGELLIGFPPAGSNDPIVDLSALNGIQNVGPLTIIGNTELETLTGLESLQEIGEDLSITLNDKLFDIDALSSVTSLLNKLVIERNAKINNLDGLSGITSMIEFEGVVPVVHIYDNMELENINGLFNLNFPNRGNVAILSNPMLTNLDGLSNISPTIDALLIWDNESLNSLAGISNLQSTEAELSIIGNESLQNLNGLHNLTNVSSNLEILGNNLSDLSGLDNLISVEGELYISFDQFMTSLSGLENVNSVGRLWIRELNFLTNLDALDNLNSIESDLQISGNESLTDFCGLQNLVDQNGIGGQYIVNTNGYNPTLQDLIDGNCSQ